MNIREVIEQLEVVATALPDGLDSEVQIHICNGYDKPGVFTKEIVVDQMWVQDQRTLAVREGFAVVQGHPHRQESGTESRPVTMGADEALQRWSAEGTAPSPPPTPPPGAKFVSLPLDDGRFANLPFTEDGIPLLPGAPASVASGCICDPEKNNHGWGFQHNEDGAALVIYKDGCPVHTIVDMPPDPDHDG